MIAGFKRVVTAVDEKGRSIVSEETSLEPIEISVFPGSAFYTVWGYDNLPSVPVEQPSAVQAPFWPAPSGSRFGITLFAPGEAALAAEIDEAAYNAMVPEFEEKCPGYIDAFEPDGKGMHTSQTIEYLIVFSGELYLLLDDGAEVRLPAGTCIVENGTRHSFENRGDVPALLAWVLLGAPS